MNSPQAFDEEKYKRLLCGLECCEVMLSEAKSLTGEQRLDSEYYKKIFMINQAKIRTIPYSKFSTYCNYIKKGIFDLSPNNYLQEGIPFIRTSEIKNCIIDFTNTVYLSDKVHNQNISTKLTSGDLVFTKIGAYIGDVALLPKRFTEYNFSQNVAGISIKNKKVSPFLLFFFLSKFGYLQIIRSIMLSGQGKIELADIKNYEIPNVSNNFYSICLDYLTDAESLLDNANIAYTSAETLLLTSLNLQNFTPSRQNTSVKTFAETFASGRLDAEYYRAKYDEIEEKIKSYQYGYSIVGKCFQPVRDDFDRKENSYPYIEIGDVNIGTATAEHNIISTEDLPDNAKIKVEAGDILVSKVRPNRGAVTIVKDIPNLIVSGAFCVLRSTKTYSPETLLVLLRTAVYKEWLLKWNVGTSYPVIKDKDVSNLPIPLLPKNIQQQISAKVKESFALREQSKQLLKAATRAVEIAIEEGEAAAFKYLEAQIL